MAAKLGPTFLFLSCCGIVALDNGLARKPPMGFNSWMAIGSGVSSSYLLEIASFFSTSGLQAAGYNYIDTDGKWSRLLCNLCVTVYGIWIRTSFMHMIRHVTVI